MSSMNSILYTQFLRLHRLYSEDSDFSLKSEARENEAREHIPVPYDNHFQSILRACKYRESHDRKENSDFLLLRQKDPFGELFFRNILSKFQRAHIFVKSRKVRNTAQSTKMADGIYPKLYIFNTPEQKEGNLPGFHIHAVCNLSFGHSSEVKVILK